MTDAGTTDPLPRRKPAGRPGTGWRRSRPFWGGLLMLLAGAELLAIPLSGVLIQGEVRMVIYIGIGGVSGVLIGALLVAAAIAVWANPAHRVFYGIAGIILGILSFPASNLGGFFIGMLLAIIGGALAFAWSPAGPSPGRRPDRPAAPADTRACPPALTDDDPPQQQRRAFGGIRPGPGFGRTGYRMLALAGLPCLLLCTPPAGPSPSPTAPGKSGPLPSALPSPGSEMNLPGTPAAGGKPARKSPAVKQAGPPPGLLAPGTASALTAKTSTLRQLHFARVTTLPVGGGGSEKVLEFTAGSAVLSTVGITIVQSGHTVLTKTASLNMPNGMTLYTTRLCGQVEGIAPDTCFTPSVASQIALKLASALGKAAPITMTSVTAAQFLDIAPAARWGPLTMNAS